LQPRGLLVHFGLLQEAVESFEQQYNSMHTQDLPCMHTNSLWNDPIMNRDVGRRWKARCVVAALNCAVATLVASFIVVLLGSSTSCAQDASNSQEYLLLYSGSSTQAANINLTVGIRQVLEAHDAGALNLATEYRDIHRFPGEPAERLFREKLRELYSGKTFEAIFVLGGEVLPLAISLRDELWSDVPIVVGGVSEATLSSIELPSDVRAVVSTFDVAGTIAIARLLQPGASEIVVMSGSAPFDRSWEETARTALGGTTDIPVTYVSDLSIDGFSSHAANLDPDTILLILTIFQDAGGQAFTPADAAKQITATSAAPAYSVYETFLGDGVVGGQIQTFETIGRRMAEIAISAKSWRPDDSTKLTVASELIVDAAQAARYGLSLSALPVHATILNPPFSIWDTYRWQIIGLASIIVIQMATIITLLVQRRLLSRAAREISARKADLARASRRGHLGELTSAIAHELNQPLTAILADAEAGLDLTHVDPPDMDELRAILSDIADADKRAAQIIIGLRQLASREEPRLVELDLNDVVERTLLLTRSEILRHGVSLDVNLAAVPLPIRGNLTQLKQVLLNLFMNAVDAMNGSGNARRVLSVTTRLRDDEWRVVVVTDTGHGLLGPAEDLFNPFATTKAKGLGLGLSVSRSIIEAHGGTIWFDESLTTGASVVLSLPAR
jgi:signal transduction histidine kinase